jgi:hypothetical protein
METPGLKDSESTLKEVETLNKLII